MDLGWVGPIPGEQHQDWEELVEPPEFIAFSVQSSSQIIVRKG